VHQVAEYDRERGISYWTKNYRTGIELGDDAALDRRYTYYDPIATLPDSGRQWWAERQRRAGGWIAVADERAAGSRAASAADLLH
jgi:lysine 2,3-aminomutase